MPEGPEIRRAADKVARVLVGNRVENVSFGLPQLKRFEKRLAGPGAKPCSRASTMA
jgi:endonuclease-8